MSDFMECQNTHESLMIQLSEVAKSLAKAEYDYLSSKHRSEAEEDRQYLKLKADATIKKTDSQLKAESRQRAYVHVARAIVKESRFKRLKRAYSIIEKKDVFNNIAASNAKGEVARFK